MDDEPTSLTDVTVRLPVGWNAATCAGFIERAVSDAFQSNGFAGSAFVIFLADDGAFYSFLDGEGVSKYEGVLPHGLAVAP